MISGNGLNWHEEFYFSSEACAISFVKDKNTYFFGLGSYFEQGPENIFISPETGHLLRYNQDNKNDYYRTSNLICSTLNNVQGHLEAK